MKKIGIIACLVFLFAAQPAFARSGCCSHHGGVMSNGCGCNDGTPLSNTCAPYYVCSGTAQTSVRTVATWTPTSTPTPTQKPTLTKKPKPTKKPVKKVVKKITPKATISK